VLWLYVLLGVDRGVGVRVCGGCVGGGELVCCWCCACLVCWLASCVCVCGCVFAWLLLCMVRDCGVSAAADAAAVV